MNIIARAAVAVYDGSPIAPILPETFGKVTEEAGEYLSAVAEKIMNSDATRTTCVESGGAQEELLLRFVRLPFAEAAHALLAAMDESMQTLEIPREGFDLAVFTFDRENDPHLCVALLPLRRMLLNDVQPAETGYATQLLAQGAALCPPGGKGSAGFVVNLSTGDIRLRDTNVLTNVGNRQLFSEALFAMAATRTTKDAVKAATAVLEEAAPIDMPAQELAPAVKRAMSKSIEEKGVIDLRDVAEEVFRSDPEREAIIEQVAARMQEEAIEPVIPVENKRVMAQMQRVKIRTDNGISITLPRTLADDEDSFAVVSNADGTISIIINRVQTLKTE